MTTKQKQRANGKILHDASQYLQLVRQLAVIRGALGKIEKALSDEQVTFIKSLDPIIDKAAPIAEEVSKVCMELNELPSSTPAHRRRAVARNLNTMLNENAMHISEVIAVILEAGQIVAEFEGTNPESIQTETDGE